MQSVISSDLSPRAGSLQRSLPFRIALVVAASLFVAVCSHISLPLPFTPVPLTLQNFAVLVVGIALGPVAGFSAMVLYLAEGAMGMPVFNPSGLGGVAQLLGPTGGYLFSYPLAAAVIGWAVRATPGIGSRFARGIVGGIAASLVIFTFGAFWLGHLLHLSTSATFAVAVTPFLLGEVVKITAAAGIFSTTQRWKRS